MLATKYPHNNDELTYSERSLRGHLPRPRCAGQLTDIGEANYTPKYN